MKNDYLDKLIKEVIDANIKDVLLEMSFNRGVYKNKIENLFPQIIENWCLVHYCNLTQNTQYKNHWIGELKGHLRTCARFGIKPTDNYKNRLSAINNVIDDNDFENPKIINFVISTKFEKENISIKDNIYQYILGDCSREINTIADVIASQSMEKIDEYTKKLY